MKIIKKILVALLVVFIIMQFFGPDKNEGELASIDAFIADTQPPADVHDILKNTCFDCHSDVTRYPWYNNITPVNYWMAEHVEDGKKHFNVSAWDTYDLKKKKHKMDELVEEVMEKKMPLPSYTYTHGDAKLTEAQILAIKDWADRVRFRYMFDGEAQ
ncbi:heme-binding domain-containing protein [Psychroserpens algicola]|uniref:Heme-binding domain-containing protein n=1 Tax=Psychroserpens algicola TaxID=1719034 RepID=A0ABT0H4X9_9FLAO|nr:heme-binding domain-containing protein [Psychroserpens algicola]MCK8479423.1 heme-binding domain-containing protein [Psychroserpens algicola]